jgi:hypothetical protein
VDSEIGGRSELRVTEAPINAPSRERWEELCEQVLVEQDPEKFLEIVRELDGELEQQMNQIKGARHRGHA